MIYEFALAQTLSLILGHSALRYPIAIGIYKAALGFGSLFFEKLFPSVESNVLRLVKIELVISIVACLSMVFLFLINSLFVNGWVSVGEIYEKTILISLTHGLVFVIGVLSGAELPILMQMSEENRLLSSAKVLSADYFGTLIAAVIFPLILLPNIHLFSIVIMATVVNLASAFLIIKVFGKENLIIKNKLKLFLWPTFSILLLFSLEWIY
jgi:spermidine synthase